MGLGGFNKLDLDDRTRLLAWARVKQQPSAEQRVPLKKLGDLAKAASSRRRRGPR